MPSGGRCCSRGLGHSRYRAAPRAARHFAETLGLRTPLVLHDGAAVQDPLTGALAYQDPLPPALVVRLTAAILAHGLHPVACRLTADPSGDTLHVLAESERDPLMAVYLAARRPVARGDRAALERAAPVVRLSGMGPEAADRRFTAHVEGRLEELGCAVRLNAPLAYAALPFHMAQVTNRGCTKALALAARPRATASAWPTASPSATARTTWSCCARWGRRRRWGGHGPGPAGRPRRRRAHRREQRRGRGRRGRRAVRAAPALTLHVILNIKRYLLPR